MLHTLLEQRLQAAVAGILPEVRLESVRVRPAKEARFGDYQSDALMALAKERRLNPRALAGQVVAQLDVSDLCEPVEIAGPGFLNFRVKPQALGAVIAAAAGGEHLFFQPAPVPRTIVVDFSSPNVAKPMHVGHIRSTGIGDSIQRVLRMLGHRVITDNHLGDWGTQFGKLLVGWKQRLNRTSLAAAPMTELERLYREVHFGAEASPTDLALAAAQISQLQAGSPPAVALWETALQLPPAAFAAQFTGDALKQLTEPAARALGLLASSGLVDRDRFIHQRAELLADLASVVAYARNANPPLLDQARSELVKLQAGDAENLEIWKEMTRLSQAQFGSVYGRLGIRFDFTLGESFYQPQLSSVVEDLLARGIARESEGAVAVFSDGSLPSKEDPFLVNREGEWVPDPALIRKSDGGFNYMTTDLATIDHRIKTWSPDEIIYVVDDRQSPHFRKLFLAFRRWQPEHNGRVQLRHVGFGKILGDDGKPYKTRSGDTIKLASLLDEAEERALQVVTGKRPELDEGTRREIARIVGIGAVKYQDLLPNRQSDYTFSWEKMLALTGNTAPYLQYQFTRANKVTRDGGTYDRSLLASIAPADPAELALVKHLLNFGLTLEAVGDEGRPNYLCNYLYDLAGLYSRFYDQCPVLKSEEPLRTLRLALCDLTARVLKTGLGALGIEAPEVM